jgi:hypothetical protein
MQAGRERHRKETYATARGWATAASPSGGVTMDLSMLKPIVDQLFQGKDRVSKREIESRGPSIGLPEDQVRSLPDKEFTKDELLEHLGGSGLGGELGDLGRKVA